MVSYRPFVAVTGMQNNPKDRLTSSVTGPDDGVASPRLFGGSPLLHSLNLNSVARSGARGVRKLENAKW